MTALTVPIAVRMSAPFGPPGRSRSHRQEHMADEAVVPGTSGPRPRRSSLALVEPITRTYTVHHHGLMSLRALMVLAAISLALTGCGIGQLGGSPASQGEVGSQCSIKYVPGDGLPSESQTYGVINLTVINGTSDPFDPNMYQVYVFKSPRVQDGTANVPESWKGEVAPGAQETFVGGDLWPLTDTCSLAAFG